MGSCLAPILANIILTEFEKLVIDDLITTGILKFYRRYVDDTLVLIKPEDIPRVLEKFNSFDPSLKFTVDTFENGNVHFLDIEIISENGIDAYRKPTYTGPYTRFDSFEPSPRKTAWIKPLFHRAVRICSNSRLLNRQIGQMAKFMSWNGFTANMRASIIRKLKIKYSVVSHQTGIESETTNQDDNNNATDDTRPLIWLRVPFLGVQGEFLVKKLIKKIQRNLTKQVKFIVIYQTKKVSYYLPKKDKIPDASRSNLVYEFVCPVCNETYIGKTERNIKTRL